MIKHITGIRRNQMFFSSLEDTILHENPVRFVDAFVEALSLPTVGFSVQTIKTGGRPRFDTKSSKFIHQVIVPLLFVKQVNFELQFPKSHHQKQNHIRE
jgi:hypothetical protein